MTTEEKAKDIARKWYHDNAPDTAYRAAIQMAKWKDKQMWLLIDAIDYAYLQTDGSYGDLSPVVSDKIRFLKETMMRDKLD